MRSSADDSHVVEFYNSPDYPGPINIRRNFHNETSLTLKWEQNPSVKNTTGYLTEWVEEERNKTFQLISSLPEVQIFNLRSGAHYTFQVRSRQDNNVFGKLSEATSFTTRTSMPYNVWLCSD